MYIIRIHYISLSMIIHHWVAVASGSRFVHLFHVAHNCTREFRSVQVSQKLFSWRYLASPLLKNLVLSQNKVPKYPMLFVCPKFCIYLYIILV